MRKYLIYYQVAFKDLLAYKADFIVYIMANMVFFFIYFAIWKNIYASTGVTDIHSYSLVSTITYYFITSFLYRLEPNGAMYLNEAIWNGNFTNDLIKPWNAVLVDITYTLSELALQVLLYIPFCLFIFIVAIDYLSLPSFANLGYFLVTIFLGIFLNIAFYEVFHALCFHFGDQEANISLINFVVALPAGGFFPLAFLPENIRAIVNVLPFRFLFDTPANIYLGKLPFSEIASAWGQMLLWTIGFFIIFYFIYKSGLKKYTGTGR